MTKTRLEWHFQMQCHFHLKIRLWALPSTRAFRCTASFADRVWPMFVFSSHSEQIEVTTVEFPHSFLENGLAVTEGVEGVLAVVRPVAARPHTAEGQRLQSRHRVGLHLPQVLEWQRQLQPNESAMRQILIHRVLQKESAWETKLALQKFKITSCPSKRNVRFLKLIQNFPRVCQKKKQQAP